MHSVLHKRLTAFKSLTVVLISTGMVIIGTLAFAFLPTEAQMKVADGFRIFDFSEKWQEPIGGVSFALEVADDFYEEFYLALGQVSAPFGKYGESLVVAYQSNATAFKPSDEIWMPRVAGESLDSNSPQPPLNLRETPSLTTRRGLGGTASGKAGELYTQELTQVIREINNYTLKASLTEQELLDLISASDQLKQMLKGEKGDKGDQGSQGPAGAGITYSSPNITNPGSFGGITYFGSKDIRTETLNITSDITQSGGTSTLNALTVTNGTTLSGSLTVSGTTTLNGLTITNSTFTATAQSTFTKVPTLPHVFTSFPAGTSNASDGTVYINPASSIADGNLISAAVGGTIKFLVDAEGDVYGGNLILTGSTSSGSTTIAGNLTVQDSTTFGDAATDTLTFTAVANSNLTFTKADPSIILNVTTATDTDFWLGVQDDAGSDDDDTFQIGDGITPGTNAFLTLDTSGNLTLSSLTASRLVFTDANKALSSSSSSSTVAASLSDETGSGNLVFSTSPTLVTPALGTPSALVGTNITGTASGLTAGTVTTNANLTGPITSVGNATSIAAQTGTGTTFVMQTSPTLTTPALGTPSSAVLTNATGLPISTGVSGLATGIATLLATPSSANLISAITDETGSGALVFATSPTLVTPTLGVATATSINKVAITAPATSATLTIADGKTLTASNTLTFTGTDASSVAFGTGGTVAYTANNLSVFAATTSLQLLGVISDETGSGALVFATSPTLVTPVLGVASATSLTTSGQGALQIGPYGAAAGNTSEARFLELAANGVNYTGFRSPDSLAGNVIYTLPSADGTSGQVLTTNGSGVLSWTTKTEGTTQNFKGLSLRTSPNADVAATTVTLDHADEIVMDTGNRVATWDDLSAVITTAGAGGLDTGSEAASTWYEIYAIRKSSDGTKNLLLHRAKDYFLDEQNTGTTGNEPLRSDASHTKLGQTFSTNQTGPLEFADVRLFKTGSPTGRIWLSIYATDGTAPTGSALKTSDKLDVSLLTASSAGQWVRFVFRDPQTITATTTYALVLEGDYTIDGTNYAQWQGEAGYGNGTEYLFNGSTWTSQTFDTAFKIYITRNDTSVTMPTGYDQKAKVGWVYNNGSSNFVPFQALDHTVSYTGDLDATFASVTETIPTLYDYSTALPPGLVTNFWQYVLGVSTATLTMHGVPYGYASHNNGAVRVENWSGGAQPLGPVSTEYQALYLTTSSGTATFRQVIGFTWGSTGGADLAEEYLVHDESINAGDVVSLTDELLYVERASTDSPHVLGIVSTKPGVTLRDWPGGISPENNRAIALAGRVPVKISKENGEVKVGDRLTLSKTLPGYAMKQTTSGQSIGIVMEESLGKDKVLTFINLSYWTPVMQLSVAQNSDGDIVDTSDQYDLNGFSFINVKAIASISGKWSIDENGNIVAVSITAEKARLNKLEMVDQGTGEIYCTWIEFGEWLKVAGECLDRDGESDNSSGEVAGESTEMTVDDNNNDDLASDSIPDATTPDSDPGEGSPESSPSESSTEIPDQVGDGTSETTPEPEPVIEEPAAEPVVEGGL